MKITPMLSDKAVLALLGERVSRQRLARNLTQAELAEAAGVSKRTIERLEAGESTQLSNFIRILRAIELVEGFGDLVPAPPPSPLEQLRLQGKQRQRASALRDPASANARWTWKDEA